MASVKILLNKSRIKNDNTYPLVFQVIHDRRKKIIYSKRHLREEDFDSVRGRVVSKRGRRSAALNEIDDYIQKTYFELKKAISEFERSGVKFTVDDIVSGNRLKLKNESVLIYIKNITTNFKESGKDNTACSYKSTYNRLAGYLNNDEKFSFSEISTPWLQQFVEFLGSQGLCTATIGFYLRVFSSSYNKALADDLFVGTYRSPFAKVRIPIQKTVKRAVSAEIIATIAQVDLSSHPKLDNARDIFMTSFYSRGMSFIDLSHLKWSNINEGKLSYIRSKTGQSIVVDIEKPLMDIFLKYRTDSEYIFPIIVSVTKSSFTQYRSFLRRTNERLAELSEYLHLSEKLTTYVARHSWATIAKGLGIPLIVISESLGHTSEKTTMIYLKGLDSSVLQQANALVCSHVSSQKEEFID